MKLLIVGYGKMGQLVDQLASEQGMEVVGRVDAGREEWAPADAAIDFSTADALLVALERAAKLFRAPAAFTALRRAAMARDSSWAASAEQYVQLYRSLHRT